MKLWPHTEMDGMLAELSVPWTRPWTAGGCSHEPLDSTALQLAFEIRFHYCVKVNGAVSAETYCGEKRESTCVLNGIKLLTDQRHYISHQYIFFYDPAGLPISFYAKGKSSVFFNDPSNLAEWEKYSYSTTLDSDPRQEEDRVNPDVRYKLHWEGGSQVDDPDTWEQTLLLFLFLHYSDQFQDKPFYDFCMYKIA
ncbi:unnamed protein product [Caretta caretta]